MQTLKVEQQTVEDRKRHAREQSAIFSTRLALARWMSVMEPQLHHIHPPPRVAWLAKAQRDFQAWLDNGGFVQYDEVEVRSNETHRFARCGQLAAGLAPARVNEMDASHLYRRKLSKEQEKES